MDDCILKRRLLALAEIKNASKCFNMVSTPTEIVQIALDVSVRSAFAAAAAIQYRTLDNTLSTWRGLEIANTAGPFDAPPPPRPN